MKECEKCIHSFPTPVCSIWHELSKRQQEDAKWDRCERQLNRLPKLTDITELTADIHKNAIKHGWWEEPRSFGDIIALCHSELSEALEEHRKGKTPTEVYYEDGKPEGIGVELADVVIRIMDYCGREGIDLQKLIEIKHEFNKSRPYKHGGKVI